MSSNTTTEKELVLPRPGDKPHDPRKPGLKAPPEKAFTDNFGTLLPPVKYLKTDQNVNVAYYEMLPEPTSATKGATTSKPATPDRVLLLHGVQTPSLGMYPLASELRKSFPQTHFVFLDLYGHGLSDTPIVAHEPELFLKLIDALLDHLNWASVHLLGFSFGGALSAGYAGTRPSRVNSISLIAPGGLMYATQFTAEQQAHLRGGGDEVAARKWVFELLEDGELKVPADWKESVAKGQVVAEAVREWQVREHPGHVPSVVAIIRDGGVMDRHEAYKKAAKTGVPAIFVLGEHDGICTKQDVHDVGFENVVIVPATGHVVVREKALESAKVIGDFWKGLDKVERN